MTIKTSFLLNLIIITSLCNSLLSSAMAGKQPAPENLRVFALNLWQEGEEVENGFDLIVDLIADAKADIVAISEVRNRNNRDFHERLIAALKRKGQTFHGMYAGGDAGLISRYPILDAQAVFAATKKEDAGCIIAYHIQVTTNLTIVVGSAHLDWRHFATYAPRGYHHSTFKIIDPDQDGNPNPITDLKQIMQIDRDSVRDEAIHAFVDYIQVNKLDAGPVILMGDFNECSHLDWTEQTVDLYSHNGMVISWANSRFLNDHNFTDAYRELYPDPVTHPGATWPSEAHGRSSTSWTPKCDERDRIDFVYYNKNQLQVTAAAVAGSPKYYVYNELSEPMTDDNFLLTEHPWPSDHKGVIVDFSVSPKP